SKVVPGVTVLIPTPVWAYIAVLVISNTPLNTNNFLFIIFVKFKVAWILFLINSHYRHLLFLL
ncbi:hypothetical protein, partial [Bacillus sp. SIMBA_005]|uniref:hypothetical protein n=1 Tax=Bacillus sp. SIMBA_005 TaxID=3085754 RepID=UPI0039788890